jgi:hypothetical protein
MVASEGEQDKDWEVGRTGLGVEFAARPRPAQGGSSSEPDSQAGVPQS